MENINNFLEGCYSLDIPKTDLFQTADLFDGTNIPQVINGIHALGRKVRLIMHALHAYTNTTIGQY